MLSGDDISSTKPWNYIPVSPENKPKQTLTSRYNSGAGVTDNLDAHLWMLHSAYADLPLFLHCVWVCVCLGVCNFFGLCLCVLTGTKVQRETKCAPLAFVIICQFSLRQLPLSSLSDLTYGSETVTLWHLHLSMCAGWNVEVLPLTSACQLPLPSPPYLFPCNGRLLEIRIIISQRSLRLFMQPLKWRQRLGVTFWHQLKMAW